MVSEVKHVQATSLDVEHESIDVRFDSCSTCARIQPFHLHGFIHEFALSLHKQLNSTIA